MSERGASVAAIAEVEARLGVRLPDDHTAFLRWSNGWEGEFGETWFVLDDTDSIADANDEGFRKAFPGYVAIGRNGGLETYAFDFRRGVTNRSGSAQAAALTCAFGHAFDRNSIVHSDDDPMHGSPARISALAGGTSIALIRSAHVPRSGEFPVIGPPSCP